MEMLVTSAALGGVGNLQIVLDGNVIHSTTMGDEYVSNMQIKNM